MNEKRKSLSKRREIALHLEKCLATTKNSDFIKVTREMLHNPVYMSLDIYSRELLRYMLDWATHSKLFWDTGKFEYSASLAVKTGFISERKAFYCFKELTNKGFINKEITPYRGLPNLWSFSKRWQVNSIEEVKKQEIDMNIENYGTSKKSRHGK